MIPSTSRLNLLKNEFTSGVGELFAKVIDRDMDELKATVFKNIAPLALAFYTILYFYLDKKIATLSCLVMLGLSLLARYIHKFIRSTIWLTNYLLILGTFNLIFCGIDIGVYSFVLAPWILFLICIPIFLAHLPTMIFWWIISVVLLGTLISTQISYRSIELPIEEILTWLGISLSGFFIMLSALIWLAVKIFQASQSQIIKSESSIKNLLKCLVHDISNGLSLIEFAHTRIAADAASQQLPNKSAIKALEKGVEKTRSLVSQIKSMEGLQAGRIAIQLELCDLRALCLESLENFKHELETKFLTVDLNIPQQPVIISTNFVILKMNIFENILSNAIKFSFDHQKINISLTQNDHHWILSVRDFGVGMTGDKVHSLLDSDHIDPSKGTHGEEGAGFGVEIIKNFAETLGYQLQIQSWTGLDGGEPRGTEFRILIPDSATNSSFTATSNRPA